MDPLTTALGRFALTEFRPGQREVIEAILGGRHTVAIMPTGAGKSLCYQLPAALLDGVALVISPLISLMKDQVDSLCRRGIPATEVTSAVSEGERNRRLQDAVRGEIKLLYIAPERFRNQRFWETLSSLKISLVAIDEAHCVSQWGHDFRPDYLRLGEWLQTLQVPRLVALTATATPEVCRDIQKLLGMEKPEVFVRGFDRPNLTFRVQQTPQAEKANKIVEALRDCTEGAGIVYVGTRKNAENLAEILNEKKISAAAYHAGLKDEERERVQDLFMASKVKVLVATNAFGMGVDKRDVRVVVHADIPRSLEAYYQEAGRAGRDGKPAVCTLLFNHQDVRVQEFLIDGMAPPPEVLRATWKAVKEDPGIINNETKLAEKTGAQNGMQAQSAVRVLTNAGLLATNDVGILIATRPNEGQPPFDPEEPHRRGEQERSKLKRIVSYAYTHSCRRRALLEYFGDSAAKGLLAGCERCDNCQSNQRRLLTPDEQAQTITVLQLLYRTKGRFGRQKISSILLGQSSEGSYQSLETLPEYGALRGESKDFLWALFEDLEGVGFLETARGEYPTIGLTYLGKRALQNPTYLSLTPIIREREASNPQRAKKTTKKIVKEEPDTQLPVNPALEKKLSLLRTEIAKREQMAAFSVWSNKTLRALALIQPSTRDALLGVPGIGAEKAERFGQEILATIKEAQKNLL